MRKTLLTICLVLSSYLLFAQKLVTGKVVDAKTGIPLAGATVKSRIGKAGTSTNNDGIFKIQTGGANDILELSFIGYSPQSFPLNGQSEVTLALQPASTTLTDIVFVGNRGAGRAKTECQCDN